MRIAHRHQHVAGPRLDVRRATAPAAAAGRRRRARRQPRSARRARRRAREQHAQPAEQRPAAAIDGMSPMHDHRQRAGADEQRRAPSSPSGSSRPPSRRLNGARNGRGSGAPAAQPDQRRDVEHERGGDAHGVGARQPGTRPPLASTIRTVAAAATSSRARRRAEAGWSEPARPAACPRPTAAQQLLGVAERRVRGRHQQQHRGRRPGHRHQRRAPRPGAARCCVSPTSGAFVQSACSPAGTSSDEQERAGGGDQQREQHASAGRCAAAPGRAAAGARGRRAPAPRRRRWPAAPARGRPARSEHRRRAAARRVTGARRRRASGTAKRRRSRANTVATPHTTVTVRMPTPIQTPLRDGVAAEVEAERGRGSTAAR